MGPPDVACLSEGMRCCVPRNAAPKYQLDPPKLNGVDNSRCIATYVSQWDSLCTTAKYDDDNECGTTIVETADVVVYRNVMEMPGKTMNNAICECTVSKSGGDTQSSGKWEYSLALKEEEAATKQRNEEAVARLTNAAKVAVQWSEALRAKPPEGGGGKKRRWRRHYISNCHYLVLLSTLYGLVSGAFTAFVVYCYYVHSVM